MSSSMSQPAYSKLDMYSEPGKSAGGLDVPMRRVHDICMVFKHKTDKKVQHPGEYSDVHATTQVPADKEAKNKMEMWKQRREAILKSMQNCGLHLFCYYSRDRDEILVKIGASPQKLCDTAARMKYKLQLKKQYLSAYAEYRPDFPGRPEKKYNDRRVTSHIYETHAQDDLPDSDAIFKTIDKIHLIHHIITSKDKDCAGVDLGNLLYHDSGEFMLRAYFPLHDTAALAELKMNKLQWFTMPEEFAHKLRDYYGDRIAFYFLFLAFYWKWLVPIAAIGMALQVIDALVHTPDNVTAIPFCILMSIWSTFLPQFWRRQEAKYAIGWGTLDLMEPFEPCRPDHHGEPRINPVTAQVESFYPWQKRVWAYMVSVLVMFIAGGGLVASVLALVLYRHFHAAGGHCTISEYEDLNTCTANGGEWRQTAWGIFSFQMFMAAFVEVMNYLLTRLAQYLTKEENHRTQSEHETHMLSKVMLLKYVCSFFALYYTAFFKNHVYLFFTTPMQCLRSRSHPEGDCFLDLQSQLAVFVFFRLTVATAVKYAAPRVVLWWRSWTYGEHFISALRGRAILELADMSAAEQQSKKERYDNFTDFDETLITHGYATLFAVTSPWVCAATLIVALVKVAVDMTSLIDSRQRSIPVRARDNEPWSTAFDIYGVLAASTNVFLLIFASDQYESWTFTEKLTLFIYLEHMIFLARVLLKAFLPEVPRNVELLQLKQDNMVHRCLENIKVEQNQDFSMFRDHRGDTIDVFEHDILERDEEDDAEPVLDMRQSGQAMRESLVHEGKRHAQSMGRFPQAANRWLRGQPKQK